MRDDSPARRAGEGSAIKFSINRILSDDFGKTKNEKGKAFSTSSNFKTIRHIHYYRHESMNGAKK